MFRAHLSFVFIFFTAFTFGQITFVDVVPDSCVCVTAVPSVSNALTSYWDLDNDAVNDFSIESSSNYSNCNLGFETTALNALGSNSVAGDAPTAGNNSAFMLNAGDAINTQPSWVSQTWLRLFSHFTGFYGTYWAMVPGTYKYAGIKFYSGTTLYYGWIRLNVEVSCGVAKVIVTEYAYSTSSIQAGLGSTTSVKEYNKDNEFEVFPNPNNGSFNIKFKDNHFIKSLSINNVMGQEVKLVETPSSEWNITGLSKGVYFVKVNYSDRTRFRKIVVE